MVYFCFIVITTCYRSIIQCREHIASYVAYLCSIVAKAFQHILHRMKVYLLQSAPNNIIWKIIFIDTDYWLFNRYGLNHQLHQFVYVHLLCRMVCFFISAIWFVIFSLILCSSWKVFAFVVYIYHSKAHKLEYHYWKDTHLLLCIFPVVFYSSPSVQTAFPIASSATILAYRSCSLPSEPAITFI